MVKVKAKIDGQGQIYPIRKEETDGKAERCEHEVQHLQ